MYTISKKFVEHLIIQNLLSADKFDIYIYSLHKRLFSFLCQLTLIITGCIFFNVIEVILFSFIFKYLRSYTGGYHARTELLCFILSNLTLIFGLIIASAIKEHYLFLSILDILSVFIIILFSPVNHPNLKLTQIEMYAMQSVVHKRLIITVSLILILDIIKYENYSTIASIALIFTAISIILTKIIYPEVRYEK